MSKESELMRRSRVRQLFQALPVDKRTESGVFIFHGWLVEHHSDLLPTRPGDSCEHLKMDLIGLYKADASRSKGNVSS